MASMASRIASLFMMVRRVMRALRTLERCSARMLSFGLDVRSRALLGQMAIGKQLEEHRHEEDREERGGDHAAHYARAGGVARAGARAAREDERHDAEDERE